MKLSENFDLDEMLESQVARRMGFSEQFKPSDEVISNLKDLCINVLQPLRNNIGKPIKVNSGFRCARLNKRVKGANKSHHLFGYAADIVGVGYSNKIIFDYIRQNIPFTELIWEYGTDIEPSWVHVSFIKESLTKEIIRIR